MPYGQGFSINSKLRGNKTYRVAVQLLYKAPTKVILFPVGDLR